MIVPCERSRRIISISKGHHDEEDTLQALRVFVSQWCGIEQKQVPGATIYAFLLEAMSEVSNKDDLVHFIRDIFRSSDSVSYEDVTRQMVSALAITKVRADDGEVLIDLSGAASVSNDTTGENNRYANERTADTTNI